MTICFSVSFLKVVSDPVKGVVIFWSSLSWAVPVITGMAGLSTLKDAGWNWVRGEPTKLKYLLRATPPAHNFSENFLKLQEKWKV